ncbi:MAG: iron/manganese transporter, partial [Acidobacteria bacterium]|nr:iron/manganese transporter [Acidobacteriota bacterium]
RLLILSQVVLSLQLPFAVIPLIHFTSDRARMGSFANKTWVKVLAWSAAAVIVSLNVRLVITTVSAWLAGAGGLVSGLVIAVCAAVFLLLVWVTFEPLLRRPGRDRREGLARIFAWLPVEPLRQWLTGPRRAPVEAQPPLPPAPAPQYRRILVPLDHTPLDHRAVAHAVALAKMHGARIYLLHVEEDVTSQVYGAAAATAEVEAGQRYLDGIVAGLRAEGIDVEAAVSYSAQPKTEIVRFARAVNPDLVIMGAHGHRRLKDLIFGNTIDPVRHELEVPVLIVR